MLIYIYICLYKSITIWRWRNCKLYKSHSPPPLTHPTPPPGPPLSLTGSVLWERIFFSSTHFIQVLNWINHNEKCIANYFSVWVLIILANSSSPWLVTYKLNAEAEKYCHTLPNFKINGTSTKGSSSWVAVFTGMRKIVIFILHENLYNWYCIMYYFV